MGEYLSNPLPLTGTETYYISYHYSYFLAILLSNPLPLTGTET